VGQNHGSQQAWLLAALLVIPAGIRAQGRSDAALTVTPAFDKAVRVGQAIELRLSRPLAPETGRLAVIIDRTDWSGLLESTERGVILRPAIVPLAVGDHELEVYLVSPANQWSSLGRHPLRVVAAAPSPRAQVEPAFELTNKGQIAEGHYPSTNAPPQARFQDFTLNGAIGTTVTRGDWTTRMQITVLGVTNRNEALRVREHPDTAARVDLADYLVSAGNDRMALSLGHVSFGSHPHLFNGFASRGALATVRLGSRTDVAFSALHGSSIVGWDHLLGLERREHRVVAGTVGVEMLPSRPGGLRLEGSWLNGRLLPLTAFNESRIDDAEQSRGGGLRVIASDAKGRFRSDGGYARSSFTNPTDPRQVMTVTPLGATSRNARYLDVSYALLQGAPIGKRHRSDVVATYRHERVDPQYGSVMADLRSNFLQNAFDVQGNVGAAAVQLSYTRARDNLDEIPALLKTSTRVIQFNAAAPLAFFLPDRKPDDASGNRTWWPVVTYLLNRIHQQGTAVQPGVELYLEEQIPDQLATDQVLGLEWQLERWRVGYRVNHTFQDNRQSGSQDSDLANLMQNVTVDFIAGPQFNLQIDLAYEDAHNLKLARRESTRRVGINGVWRLDPRTVVTGFLSTTVLEDRGKTTDSGNVHFNVDLTKTVPLSRRETGRRAQLFVRYSRQAGHRIDRVFLLDDRRQRWTFNTGFSVSVF
jgi:hypothetical protein